MEGTDELAVGTPSAPPPDAIEPDPCDPAAFSEAIKDIDSLYLAITGDRCGACAAFKDDLRGAEVPHPVAEISAEQCPRLADHFGVKVVPTVVFLKKGQVVGTYEGREALEKMKQGI